MSRALLVVAILLLAQESVTWAHPGHGNDGSGHGLLHYLTEPLHFASMLGVAVLSLLLMRYLLSVIPRIRQVRNRSAV